MTNQKNIATEFIIVISVILIIIVLKQCSTKDNFSQKEFLNSLQDSLKTYKDKNQILVSEITVISSDRDLLEKSNENKDNYLEELKDLVKKEKKAKSALVAKIETLSKGASKTEIIYNEKIVEIEKINDSISYIFPTYQTQWADKWGEGKIVASRDSIFRDITFFNDFEIWETEKNVGTLFNPTIVKTIHWRNLNPNTTTDKVRTWDSKPIKSKKWALIIGPNLSLNTDGKIKAGVGASVGFKIIEK